MYKPKRMNEHSKEVNGLRIRHLCAIVLTILTFCLQAAPLGAMATADLNESTVKPPPLVPEQSVSCYLPSESSPGKGLAVNIIYPKKPRYKDGAPVAVIAPGGSGPDGLGFDMHSAQMGFVEVRFGFPGGGHGKFTSSGIFDYRGAECQKALRDVLLFAGGRMLDTEGRKISELVPVKVSADNIGIVGWSNGGNVALVTMTKYSSELQFLSWAAFYESPLGSMFFPPNLGSADDVVSNRHYRQGSGATGDCVVDYSNLSYDEYYLRRPGEHKRKGEAEIPGVLFFDENKNKRWDESLEFAFAYASDVGLDKQIYPPDVTAAMDRMGIFSKMATITVKPKKIYDKRIKTKTPRETFADILPKGVKPISSIERDEKVDRDLANGFLIKAGLPIPVDPKAKKKTEQVKIDPLEVPSAISGQDYNLIGSGRNEEKEKKYNIAVTGDVAIAPPNAALTAHKRTYTIRVDTRPDAPTPVLTRGRKALDPVGVKAVLRPPEPKGAEPDKLDMKMIFWPDDVATLKESEAYFEERDGSLYISQVVEKFPNLLVTVIATQVDHLNNQSDHPHIALQYNAWLSSKARWLRLNPDPLYVGAASGLNAGNFVNNPPKAPIDSSEIVSVLEPEGLALDYTFGEAAVSELADRKRMKYLKGAMAELLCPYDNGAFPIPIKKGEKPAG
jgi:hypothetical protein